jgi:NAD(P)-dependent dehydrogenase (short-subunit alcohol dehydrogenase family)
MRGLFTATPSSTANAFKLPARGEVGSREISVGVVRVDPASYPGLPDSNPVNADFVQALCMKYEIPQMLKQGSGAIVNCSSIAGLIGFQGIPAYTASKHGLLGLTRTAALEYATQGIRVNAVCPGVIRTAMIDRFTSGSAEAVAQLVTGEPMGRMGTPEEIASAVLWLCSEGAGFVTGHPLVVDGGWVAQ